jgi:hypothetical protein
MPLIRIGEPAESLAASMSGRRPLEGGAAAREGRAAGEGTAVPRPRFRQPPLPAAHGLRGGSSLVSAAVGRWLALAYETVEIAWPACFHGDAGLSALIGAAAVQGLEPGIHTCPPDGEGGVRYTMIAGSAALPELRRQYSDASALVFLTADFGRIPDTASGDSYGGLLSRVGAAGSVIQQSARSAGVALRIHDRPSSHATAVSRLMRPGQRHVLTLALDPERGESLAGSG